MARRSAQTVELDLQLESPSPRASVTDAVYHTLREAILDRRLAGGTPLIEASLAKQFGISKTPVREALQRLAHSGLVDFESARGATVHTLTPGEINDVYELRLLLEPAALRASVPNLTREDYTRLDRIMKDAQAAVKAHDWRKLSRANLAYHTALYSRAPNRLLVQWLDSLSDKRRLITMQGWAGENRSQSEYEEHAAILSAARHGKLDEAAEWLVAHIERFHETVQRETA